jgi:3'(2'), 5'-bisphosphate nucleotidase
MEIRELLNIAIKASVEAGKEIMNIYTDPSQDFGIEKKADNSPLTLADKAAHRCIAGYLSDTGIPLLSEEGRHQPYEERKQWRRLWIVDPLDGTKEFIKKNGEFTVNIALVEDGAPVMGVVYVPATDVLYYGIVGEGAWKKVGDTSAKRLPLDEKHEGYVIVASRSHLTPETEAYVSEMRRVHDKVTLISSGSSIKICLVAEGSADSYPRYAPTMEWDTAAGDAVARAAGSKVMDSATGKPVVYNKENLLNPWFLVLREE